MNTAEVVAHLAQAEAPRLRAVTDPAELAALAEAGHALPYVTVARDATTGGRVATGHGHIGHDNEPRMAFLTAWLQERVLPFVDPGVNVNGAYRVELHDSYSYLPDRRAHHNALTFARPCGSPDRVALLPDPYLMADYGGMLSGPDAVDDVPWAAKRPTMFFAGTTTGDRDAARNARVRACVWSLSRPDIARFHITHVAQMTLVDALARAPRLAEVLRPRVSHREHFDHRYQVNIVGNTACWSRVPMVMASGSLLLQLEHADMMWYYPMLKEGTHFRLARDLDALPALHRACEAAPLDCQRIARNANEFVSSVLTSAMAAMYTVRLLESASHAGRA